MANHDVCPSVEDLIAFQSKHGDAELSSSISAHVQQCENCQQILSNLSMERPSQGDPQSQLSFSAARDGVGETTLYASGLPGVLDETLLFPGFDHPPFEADSQNDISNRFEILGKIGQGSFASVWRARDHRLKRVVALKQSHPKRISEYSEQFYLREAQTIAQLEHPAIVAVYDILKQHQSLILICQHIEGQNLSEYLKHTAISERHAARFCLQIAQALSHAHERGIIHRDLKPANILVDLEGHPHVADFGLARNLFETIDSSDIVGTPAYMAPEQVRGENDEVDQRSDLYALGCILAEMLCGKRPFLGGAEDLNSGGKGRKITSPRQHNPRISKDLDAICLKALAESPSERYQTAEDMADDLQRYLDHRPVQCRPQSWTRNLWLGIRRNPVLASLVVVLFALLAMAWIFPSDEGAFELAEVLIASEPRGAQITFIPLEADTGLPLPEQAIQTTSIDHDGETWQTAFLPPGNYLVVAVNDETFHEVFRIVPSEKDLTPRSPYRHRNWRRLEDGRIELIFIALNFDHAALTNNMARFDGAKRFRVGDPGIPQNPPMDIAVQPYWLDSHEVTNGDFRSSLPPEKNAALQEIAPADALLPKTKISWDQAVHYCERIGKRLPDEWEYEFAASLGGTRAFPWGDTPPKESGWEIGPVTKAEKDRLPTNPPVYGLYSNALEWTSSNMLANRQLMNKGQMLGKLAENRVIKGGPTAMLETDGAPIDLPDIQSIRQRSLSDRRARFPSLGFRCARSVKPRLKPEDFSRIIAE